MRFSTATRGAASAALIALAACQQQGPEPGVYELMLVNQKPVPETLEYQDYCVIVLGSGSMSILKPDSFASVFRIMKNCADSTVTVPNPGTRGTFTFEGDSLFFLTLSGGSGGTGFWSGDTIRIAGPRHSLTYVREAGE